MSDLPVVPGIDPEALNSPWWRMNNLYKIITKTDGEAVRMRLKPQQAEVYKNMHCLNVILKARQLGFTTFIQLFMLDRCIWNPNTQAGVIAHTKDDASSFFDLKIKYAYDTLPAEIKEWAPVNTKNRLELSFAHNHSRIRVGTSMRGGTLNYLHVSEFGKICAQYPEKAREIVTGAFNTVAPGQYIFIESTAEGRGGKFYDICQQAQDQQSSGLPLGELDFKFFFFPWYDEPTYRLQERFDIPESFEDYFEQIKHDDGIELDNEQKRWYVKKESNQMGEEMKREYPATPKEAFQQQLKGAIFGQQMRAAYDDSPPRVGPVPFKRGVPVNTFWDLGRSDATAIWFHQKVGAFDHFIHYHEHSVVDLTYYIEKLREFERKHGYQYGTAYLPHDGSAKRLESLAGSAEDILRTYGFKVRVVPRTPFKLKSIEETRKKFDSCRFDETRCEKGLVCLENYQWTWDDEQKRISYAPLHNHASNGADAFQVFGNARMVSVFGDYSNSGTVGSDISRKSQQRWDSVFNPSRKLT